MIREIIKPWGKEEVLHIDQRYMMKRLTMHQGHRCSLQFHRFKTETVYLISGKLRVLLGESQHALQEHILGPNDSLTVLPNQVHRMEALESSVYLEASTPEMEDVVRLNDDYQRSQVV